MNKIKSLDFIVHAILALNNKRVIAYPTEAVFGIGCDPDSETAVLRLLAIKKRPIEKGLILIASRYEQFKPYINDSTINKMRHNEILSMWPGHVTFVFPAMPTTPHWLTGKFNSIAIRVTNHPMIIKLCEMFGKPIVSTSANLTGLLPCRTVDEVRKQFGDSLHIVIGETGGHQNLSEIRDALTDERFR